MNPQDIPFMLCGALCLIPILAGLSGFFIPFMLARRLPILHIERSRKQGRSITDLELSLESKEDRRQAAKLNRGDKS